jgi:hypothetical protein
LAQLACLPAVLIIEASKRRRYPAAMGEAGIAMGGAKTNSGWPNEWLADLRRAPLRIRVVLLVLVVLVAVAAYRSFDGVEFYVLEPGLDEGLVYARTYSWWGFADRTYELSRFEDDDGSPTWHIRKRGASGKWSPLYGPGEHGGLSMWFPY